MKLKNTLSKGFIITFTLLIVGLFGSFITKVNAATTTQTTLKNKIEETLENNKTYALNTHMPHLTIVLQHQYPIRHQQLNLSFFTIKSMAKQLFTQRT